MSDPTTATTTPNATAKPPAFTWPAPLASIGRDQLQSMARERGAGASCALAVILRSDGSDVAAWADSEQDLLDVEIHFHQPETIDNAKAAGVRVIGGSVLESIASAAAAGVPAVGVGGDLVPTGVLSLVVGTIRAIACNRLDVPDHAVPVFVLSSRDKEVARLVGEVRIDFHKAVPEWAGDGGTTDDEQAGEAESFRSLDGFTPADTSDEREVTLCRDLTAEGWETLVVRLPEERRDSLTATAHAIAKAQAAHSDEGLGRREAVLLAHQSLVSSYGDNVAEIQQLANKVCHDLRVLFLAMRRQEPEDVRTVLMRVNGARGSLDLFATVLRQIADAIGVYDQSAATDVLSLAGDALALGKRLDLIVQREAPATSEADAARES